MPDICAAIGLAQIREYRQKLLPERKSIFDRYNDFFSMKNWAIVPETKNSFSESSYHLYMLRINGISEIQRDKMISHIKSKFKITTLPSFFRWTLSWFGEEKI